MSEPRILIIDSDVPNLDLMSELCVSAGYKTIGVSDGGRALQAARQERPDLILLDILMADVSGYELLAKLKVDIKTSDIPVVLVTAADEAEGKMRGLESGAADYLQKPFHAVEFLQRVRNVLELYQAKRQLREAESELMAMRATDPVTGVGNFQRLHAVLEYEYSRAIRYNRPLSCAVIADDSLDAFLSSHGREKADDVLKEITKTIRTEVREVDRIFRIDMAEFVVIFPETTTTGARVAIDRIADKIMLSEAEADRRPRISSALASLPHVQVKRSEDLFRAVNLALAQARARVEKDPALIEFQSF